MGSLLSGLSALDVRYNVEIISDDRLVSMDLRNVDHPAGMPSESMTIGIVVAVTMQFVVAAGNLQTRRRQ